MADGAGAAGSHGDERLVLGRDYRIRSVTKPDGELRRFIEMTWRLSYSRPWSDFAATPGAPSFDVYHRCQGKAMELAIEGGEVLLACDVQDADLVLGWLCLKRPDVGHYVYVKEPYRGQGVARALFTEAFGDAKKIYATHIHTSGIRTELTRRRTADGKLDGKYPVPVWRAFGRRLLFSPWLIFSGGAA